MVSANVGALIIRVGFWGFLIIIMVYYTPNPILIIQAPILNCRSPMWVQGFGDRV